MKRIFILAFMMLTLVTASIPVVIVAAQGEAVTVAPEITFGWVILAWLIYAIVGLIAGISNPGESFDVLKFARSFIIMILTAIIAIGLHLTPGAVTTQFGGILDTIATFILNTGPGLWLIYTFDKTYKLIMNAKTKLEAARALSTPGPPKS